MVVIRRNTENLGHGCPFSGVPCQKRLSCKPAFKCSHDFYVYNLMHSGENDICGVTLSLKAQK